MFYYTLSRFLRHVRNRRELGAAYLLSILVVSVLGNALIFYVSDRVNWPGLTIGDSLWYSIISITTIGYGDFSATNVWSRIGTVFFIIIIGLASFTTFVGITVDWILELRDKERLGMQKSVAKDHLIIVNYPNESRVRQIIDEFTRDQQHRKGEVVIVTDKFSELPFELPHVSFTRGSPLEQDTFERCNIGDSLQAIVLSPSYDDPRSDSFVASITFVIEHMSPETNIVVECLDPKHAILFKESDRISLVYTVQAANNLLVQESQDPGVNMLTQTITSNVTEIEETLASAIVGPIHNGPVSYTEASKKLLDYGVNIVGIIRDGDVIVGLQDITIAEGDSVVYISKNRQSWEDIVVMLR